MPDKYTIATKTEAYSIWHTDDLFDEDADDFGYHIQQIYLYELNQVVYYQELVHYFTTRMFELLRENTTMCDDVIQLVIDFM